MGFGFGGISATTSSVKHLGKDKIDSLVLDKFDEKEEKYFIFLCENSPDKNRLNMLLKIAENAGIKSYVVLNVSNLKISSKELEKAGYINFYSQNESDWKKYLTYKGKKVHSIMTFGPAMYCLNKEAKIMPQHFLAHKFVKTYYYLGHTKIGNFDCFVYPTYSLSEIYPMSRKGDFGDSCWITRWTIAQLKKMAACNEQLPDLREPKIHLIDNVEDAKKCFLNLMDSDILSWDIETNSLDFYTGKIHCLTLCNDGVNGYFIPWKIIEEGNLKRIWSACLQTAKKNVGSNLKFDLKWMWHNKSCIGTYQTDDTGLLSHSIHSERPKGLKEQAFFYTMFGGYEHELDRFKKQTRIQDYSKIPNNILSEYATMDVIVTYRVFEEQLKEIRQIDINYPNEKNPEWTMEKHYSQILMPTARLFTKIEYEGFNINKPLMDKNRKIFYSMIEEQKEILAKELNTTIDYKFESTKQLGELLQREGWPCIEESKDGTYATSDKSLTLWAKMGPEYKKVTDAISNMRSYSVFVKTFLGSGDSLNPTGWQYHMRETPEHDWVIHQSYAIMGTSTYRFKGYDPNLQQIPAHSKVSNLVTSVIMPPFKDNFIGLNSEGKEIYNLPYRTLVSKDNGQIFVEDVKIGMIINGEEVVNIKTERDTKYKMFTRDYAAFQTRLGTIDTALKSDGKVYPDRMDSALSTIYAPNSDMQDLHCQTAWGLFGDSANIPIYEVEDDNGKIWKGDPKTKIETKRGIITFEELKEEDEIINYA